MIFEKFCYCQIKKRRLFFNLIFLNKCQDKKGAFFLNNDTNKENKNDLDNSNETSSTTL